MMKTEKSENLSKFKPGIIIRCDYECYLDTDNTLAESDYENCVVAPEDSLLIYLGTTTHKKWKGNVILKVLWETRVRYFIGALNSNLEDILTKDFEIIDC